MQRPEARLRRLSIDIKKILAVCLLIFGLSAAASSQSFYGTTDLKAFRDGRDNEFRNKDESPLKDGDFGKFSGLNYFPTDNRFRVIARFTRTPDEKYFQMPTSSGRTRTFFKYGTLKFRLGGKPLVLAVYQVDRETLAKYPDDADLLFVPFRDLTYRSETYGSGRYIDIKIPRGKTAILDFNLAYNPSCAYGSDRFNCPIPPRENRLSVAITAGEKRYAYSGSEKIH